MNLLELLGVAVLSAAIGAMALAFLCVHFDGSGKPLDGASIEKALRKHQRQTGRPLSLDVAEEKRHRNGPGDL